MNNHNTRSPGKLFVVSAPSGAGKTSLVKALIDRRPELRVAVSHTTRKRRRDEVDGVNYHFVDTQTFTAMQEAGAFIESAHIFGNLYGTSQAEVNRILGTGHHIILEIDWQGAAQVRQNLDNVISIFILPPSLETLKMRLLTRAQDDLETITARFNAAISEIAHYKDFDYLIVNDNFEDAVADLERIIFDEGKDRSLAVQEQQQASLIAQLLPDADK
ncbi:MAG: guanylate kinase [Pseudomonadales bacterium]